MSNVCRSAAEASLATILLALLIPLCGLTPFGARAEAAEPVAFAIPADDGYGVAECMQAGSACGHAMADSWCAAHGHGRSVAFGLSADVTGSTVADGPTPTPDAVIIRCDD